MRNCISCGAIQQESVCKACRSVRNRKRDMQRGKRAYDADYKRLRKLILANNPQCAYCGSPATTADHVIAVANGGTSTLDNLVPACKPCNESRGQALAQSRKSIRTNNRDY